MSEQIKTLVGNWNCVIETFPICYQKLQKPDSIFFIRAVSEIFKRLDINVDALCQNILNAAELGERPLAPLQQLTEAVNFLLVDMSASQPVTLYDFLAPTPPTTIVVLRLLLNFMVFVLEKKNKVTAKEESVENACKEMENVNEEIDQENMKLDANLQMTQLTKENIERMEKQALELKILNKEPETTVNDLKSEFDIIQEKKDGLSFELYEKTKIRNSLIDKINKIEVSILTENQQMEINKDKECAIQRFKDIQERSEEVRSTLWKKEQDINTFRSSALLSNKLEKQLNDLEDLYNKVKLTENSGKDSYEIEKQLKEIEDENSTLKNELVEMQSYKNQLQEDINKTHSQLSDEDKQCALLEKETQNSIEKASHELNEIENIKELTYRFSHERQQLNNSIEEIVVFYDRLIEDHANKINTTIDRVKCAEKKYLHFEK